MKTLLLLGVLGLTACVHQIDFSVEEEPQTDPLEVKDPMTTDNQRIIDDAQRDGKLNKR
ncbi:hypothetical protein [Shewanella psychrotolerans]|uniref:hypothetical protein n=1 Tax=Shewanella psychrotolerans TaxID=2864206 RepID=UPI001C65D353|nr:hypothetical protein [Shewanella psychrotolerans]QYK02218.1 hypothetical protein K0I62_04375 [Shewanella psychrotolerans]